MKGARIVAQVLLYFTRLLAIGYTGTALYVAITMIFQTNMLNIVENGQVFEISYPFTQIPYLRGENHAFYILEMIAAIGLYGLFFWLLGNVFKSFIAPKLFTPTGVRRLTLFYLANWIVPAIFLILHMSIAYETGILVFITLLHAVIGVFAFFMNAIFKQGLSLQNEQELYI